MQLLPCSWAVWYKILFGVQKDFYFYMEIFELLANYIHAIIHVQYKYHTYNTVYVLVYIQQLNTMYIHTTIEYM